MQPGHEDYRVWLAIVAAKLPNDHINRMPLESFMKHVSNETVSGMNFKIRNPSSGEGEMWRNDLVFVDLVG